MTLRASVAIVGSGPSGCYTAQVLRKLLPDTEIIIFDRLPVPYGLVRYGVAPDHVGTKGVSGQFDRLFGRGVRFVGNVDIGTTLSLEQLQACFDVVVIATGLTQDLLLPVQGASLPGVIGAGRFSRSVNEHPDELQPLPYLGQNVVVVGHGNVAVDVVRMLAKSPGDFHGSDLGDKVLWPAADDISRIEIVGRSCITDAKFDPLMIKELAHIADVAFEVHDYTARPPEQDLSHAQRARLDTIHELAALPKPEAPRRMVSFRFGLKPVDVTGAERVRGINFHADENQAMYLPADTVITAIGFGPRADGLSARALDAPGLFQVGWVARGASGSIPDNRVDAKVTAAAIEAWLRAQPESDKSGYDGVAAMLAELSVDFAQWTRVDAHERSTAPPDRSRRKVRGRDALLALARSSGGAPPSASSLAWNSKFW